MTEALEVRSAQPVAQLGEMSVQAVVDRKRKILEVMDKVMREGPDGHYGRIPGCGDKPTLFKSGAEVLATTFGLAPSFVVIETNLARDHREYRVTCTLRHIATGASLGEGVGTCSTMESKYRWRKGERVCPSCKKPAIIRGKADFGGGWLCFAKKGGCGEKWADGEKAIEGQATGKVENPDPADQYNTVLKIAKKRAQVDATLTAVGASDLLAQDLEDLPPASGDYLDAEHTESPKRDAKSDGPPAWFVAIDEAADETQLQALTLTPTLAKLKGKERDQARAKYKAKLDEINKPATEATS